jgi:Flp pilus assembly protein TadG
MKSISLRKLNQFLSSDSGQIAVMTALALTTLVGTSGITILYLQGVEQKTSLQAGLDAGVLAGTALSFSASDEERIAAAEAAFYANTTGAIFMAVDKKAEFEASTTPKPVFSVARSEVSGIAEATVENGLAAVLGKPEVTVQVGARAAKRMSDPVCMLAMNETEENSVYAYGNAEVDASNCSIQANSNSAGGLSIQGSRSSVTAKMIGTTGGYKGSNFSPKPMTDVAPVPDPYADLPVPEPDICIDAASKLNNATATLDPGTYCGGLAIKAGAIVTLNPGIYVIHDGPFAVNSGAVVKGNEVLIALVGKDSILSLMSDSRVTLSSPSSGTYKNIQFMSDRDLSESKFEEEWSTVLSGAILEYDGVAYLPEQNFWVSGTGHQAVVKGSSPSMILLADTVWAQGNARLELKREDKRGIGEDPARTGFTYGAMLVK